MSIAPREFESSTRQMYLTGIPSDWPNATRRRTASPVIEAPKTITRFFVFGEVLPQFLHGLDFLARRGDDALHGIVALTYRAGRDGVDRSAVMAEIGAQLKGQQRVLLARSAETMSAAVVV